MESWLFGENGLSADEMSVEGWHKPGSLTLCSGLWIHAAGSAVMNAGEHPIDGHRRFVWLAVAEDTPSMASRAFFTVASQWAHIMPSIWIVFVILSSSF